MDCKDYAVKLLKDNGCELNCYKGTPIEDIIADLNEYFKTNKKKSICSVETIAKYLRKIGDEQPNPIPKPFKMVFDIGHTIDGIEFDTFEAAKADMEDTYIMWMTDAMRDWKFAKDGTPQPTDKQKDEFNYMIDECCCWIVKWDSELGDYEDIDYGYVMSDEELKELGWEEIK